MDELPTDTTTVALACAVAADAVADLVESAELFDVDVDHLAGPFALVAARRFSRFESAQFVEAQALEGAAHGGGRDANPGGDLLARHALTAQRRDAFDRGLWGRLAQPMRPRAAVLQAGQALRLEALDPFAHRARANAGGFTDSLRRLPTENHIDQTLSTKGRQASIIMDFHSLLPGTVDAST